MIPYSIEYPSSRLGTSRSNVRVTYGCCDTDTRNTTFIDFIANFMYEFASPECGHDLQITSYKNFCKQYWAKQDTVVYDKYHLFDIYYFTGSDWVHWDIARYADRIYVAFIARLQML